MRVQEPEEPGAERPLDKRPEAYAGVGLSVWLNRGSGQATRNDNHFVRKISFGPVRRTAALGSRRDGSSDQLSCIGCSMAE